MDVKNKRRNMVIIGVLLVAFALLSQMPLGSFEKKASAKNGYVAVVRVDGAIVGGPARGGILGGGSYANSEEVMRQLQLARRDNSVKAVLLRINSPGGSTGATQEISEELDKIRNSGKPIVVSMGDVCASGGYWLASRGNYIFASPSTITGSIGAYMEYQNIEELMGKIGVKDEKITSGPHKDILSMYRPMTGEERAMIQNMVNEIYNQFVQTVADGRKMDESAVRKVADGRIMTGKQAQDAGLVDAMGNYYDALNYAGNLVGIDGENIPVKTYEGSVSFRDLLSGEINRAVGLFGKSVGEGLKGSLAENQVPVVK